MKDQKSEIKKTSDEWLGEREGIVLLDPDGWSRKDFEYAFYLEEIAESEFDERLSRSTVRRVGDTVVRNYLSGNEGAELKPGTQVVYDRAEADRIARDKRSYVFPAMETSKAGKSKRMVWAIPQ